MAGLRREKAGAMRAVAAGMTELQAAQEMGRGLPLKRLCTEVTS